MSWMDDQGPQEFEVSDGKGWKGKVWLIELSHKDIEERTKFLGRPDNTEQGRRGRSARGRNQQVHIERIRQFNFARCIYDWDFVYPERYWDREEKAFKPHPKAGQPVPINDYELGKIRGRVADQIEGYIDEMNEPPEESPELRGDDGEVLEEAVESPMAESYAAK